MGSEIFDSISTEDHQHFDSVAKMLNEMNIPFVFVPQKELLGQAISIDIGAAVACIVEPGDAKATLDKIIDSLNNLKDHF